MDWIWRPGVLMLFTLVAGTLLYPVWRQLRNNSAPAQQTSAR